MRFGGNMLIFHTERKYQKAEQKICGAMGYPNELTECWSKVRTAIIDKQTRWIMPKHPIVKVEFDEELEYSESWIKESL